MIDFEDIRLAVTPYLEKLAGFETAEQIRDFLVVEGIKATRGNPYSCAIAEYVYRGSEVPVRVSGACTSSASVLSSAPLSFAPPSSATLGTHTDAMCEFVGNFDQNYYPELVA